MIELSIALLFCRNREDCEKYFSYVHEARSLERDIKVLFKLIQDFYEKYDDANAITETDLKAFYDYQYPSSRDRSAYTELITRMFLVETKEALIRDLLEQMLEKQFATDIVNKLLPVMEGRQFGILPTIIEDVEKYEGNLANPPVKLDSLSPCNLSVEELIKHEIDDTGLRWPLDGLNYTIGGVRTKTLGIIFAYVDTGKTSFSVATAASFCRQLINTEQCVVYAGNEESAQRLSLRITQAFLTCLRSDIKDSPEWAEEMRRNEGYSHIKIMDNITTMDQVVKILETFHPRVLFIDQGTKLETRIKDNEVRAAQQLFNFYREAAKRYDCSIICVAQATGEAENKKWLRLSDIYGSRVAIQGELDYAIGIGRRVEDAATENIRYFHVPKNKMLDGESAKFPVTFVKEKCMWLPA